MRCWTDCAGPTTPWPAAAGPERRGGVDMAFEGLAKGWTVFEGIEIG